MSYFPDIYTRTLPHAQRRLHLAQTKRDTAETLTHGVAREASREEAARKIAVAETEIALCKRHTQVQAAIA